MNNYNPFLPQNSFLEQKNRARKRLQIAVLFSISLSVMALMALLIQGCRKPTDNTGSDMDTNASAPAPELPTNPPEVASNPAPTLPPPETNIPAPAPLPPPPAAVAPPVAQTEDYTVVKGDTFASIAKSAHVSVRAVEDANPGVDPRKLKIGQKLHMPAASAPSGSITPSASMGMGETAAAGGEPTYKVKSGDTLTAIARKFHVTIKAIQSANNLNTTSIKVGQVLKIPGGAPAPAPAPAETLPPPAAPVPPVSPAPTAAPGT